MSNKTKTNCDLIARVFPRLAPVTYMHLHRILIGLLCCLRSLWLAREIALVSVFRHSLENRSMETYLLEIERDRNSRYFSQVSIISNETPISIISSI